MSDNIKSVVRAIPKLDVLKAVLERNAAGLMSLGLRPDEAQELKIAIHLIESIEFSPAKREPKHKPLACPGCQRDVPAPLHGAIQTLTLCWACMALQNVTAWSEHNPHEISFASLRFKGHHYGVIMGSAMDDPVMTAMLQSGTRLVTTGLRYQGPVPDAYRELLRDNCVIVQGNPEGLPLGVTI